MNIQQMLENMNNYSLSQIENLKFNLEHDIFYTMVLYPNLHDQLLNACNMKLEALKNEIL